MPDLGKLLSRVGTSNPESQKFHEELKVPKNYVIAKDKIVYSQQDASIYSVSVASDLHPKELNDDEEETVLITTKVINNPVPKDFSTASIDLLQKIISMDND